MAKQTINIGTSPNKGNGDPLRTAFTKINQNFDELYSGGLKYTTTERDALVATEGMLIFNTTVKKFQGYTGTAWVDLH
jgi:hypothetical protein